MVFGKKKIKDSIEEDQLRTEDTCQVATLLQKIIGELKVRKEEAGNLKAELEDKREKYNGMVKGLDNASNTLSKFLKALGEAAETKEA